MNQATTNRQMTPFQSTPSAWRVTHSASVWVSFFKFQSTPSAWRVTGGFLHQLLIGFISIHTLRMEGDACAIEITDGSVISIHTLRVEGDANGRVKLRPVYPNFNPHPPRGG